MHIKSYFAATVEEALAEARRELGDEAMLLDARVAPAEARYLGAYEAVFATPASVERPAAAPRRVATPSSPSTKPAVVKPAAEPTPAAPRFGRLEQDVAELRRELRRMALSLGRTAAPEPAAWENLRAALAEEDVAPDVVRLLIERAVARGGPAAAAIEAELKDGVRFAPALAKRAIALVGPPGAGKTTTLAKLAMRYGVMAGRSVEIVSLDNYRIAAAEQLRSFAVILGVPFTLAETAASLAQVVGGPRPRDLVFIDTPGFAAAESDLAEAQAEILGSISELEVHLVLPATMRAADLARAVARFEVFAPARLVFTRLDETERSGAIVSEAVRSARPVSFLANGQRVPEDILEANSGAVLGRLWEALELAAPAEKEGGLAANTMAAA